MENRKTRTVDRSATEKRCKEGAGTEIAANRWLRGYMAMDAGLQLLHSQ